MAKKVLKVIKLQIAAGAATPAPPVGPALGAAGLNIMAFCKDFNAKTQDKKGDTIPVEITVYVDKTYTYITKEPPTSALIKKTLAIETASKNPNKEKVGRLSVEQIEAIAKIKYVDMGVRSLDAARRMVAGTARSMGVDTDITVQ